MRRIDFTSACFGFVLGLVAASLINKAVDRSFAQGVAGDGKTTTTDYFDCDGANLHIKRLIADIGQRCPINSTR